MTVSDAKHYSDWLRSVANSLAEEQPVTPCHKALKRAAAEMDRLTAEVSALWELADSAVLASLKLDKKVGGELIRLRSNLGLSRDSGREET